MKRFVGSKVGIQPQQSGNVLEGQEWNSNKSIGGMSADVQKKDEKFVPVNTGDNSSGKTGDMIAKSAR
jgi:hypothetical protein